MRKLKEETNLDSTSLIHWRTGKPFTFSDPSLKREWTVHPFAFRLKPTKEGGEGEPGIQLNWEHEGWEWHDPREFIADGPPNCVPRLKDTVERVYFENRCPGEAAKALAKGLDRLRHEHHDGSRHLTTIAIETFREYVSYVPAEVDEAWWKSVRMGAWHLYKNGRESMSGPILNAVLAVLNDLDKVMRNEPVASVPGSQSGHKRDRILSVFDKHLAARASMMPRIKDSLSKYLFSECTNRDGQPQKYIRILTVSSSSTIRETILDAFNDLDVETLDLRILESRPLCEGITLASSLLDEFKYRFGSKSSGKNEKKLLMQIYTDSAAVVAAKDSHVILIGADRISATGGVSNKIGSVPAIFGAKCTYPSTKVVVVSESDKISAPDEVAKEEDNPQEVVSGWSCVNIEGLESLKSCIARNDVKNAQVKVRNPYFEWVSLDEIDSLICEDGILNQDAISERSEHIGNRTSRFFGDL